MDGSLTASHTRRLIDLNRQAEADLKAGRKDEAAQAIQQAQVLATQILATPRPPVQALEAASDSDELYGRMLLENRHYGWARMAFQKNVARWKNFAPQTAESQRRLKAAEEAIAVVDRRMAR